MKRKTVAMDSRAKVSPDVVSRAIEEEEVILDLARSMYYGLDEVGTRIWTLLRAGKRLGEIVRTLAEEYDVTEERCRSDLFEFVERLERKGLVRLLHGNHS